MPSEIAFCKPYIGREEKKALCRLIDSGEIGMGEKVKEFEDAFAQYVGSKYAVAVSSGTAALYLALKKLGIKQYSRVIVPSLTFTASASVITHCGGEPVFCDVRRDTLCLDRDKVEILLAGTKAETIVNVHLTGRPSADILDARTYNPTNIIHDSAHYLERGCFLKSGTQCFSFHPTKPITTGFGGMIATDSEEDANWYRLARLHGCYKKEWAEDGFKKDAARWGYSVEFCGWKMNMNNLQAAMGLEQLKKLDWMNARRREIVDTYNECLGYNNVGLHLYPIFVSNREEFMRYMSDHGVQCSLHFQPLHKMPAYKDVPVYQPLSETEWVGQCIVSLPLFPTLKIKEVKYICQLIEKSGNLLNLRSSE